MLARLFGQTLTSLNQLNIFSNIHFDLVSDHVLVLSGRMNVNKTDYAVLLYNRLLCFFLVFAFSLVTPSARCQNAPVCMSFYAAPCCLYSSQLVFKVSNLPQLLITKPV